MTRPEISIVTPSFNMLHFLKQNVASVADQEGVKVEHLVIDAVSTDGTVEWLMENPHVTCFSEKDAGMYDALNKGFGRARGRIIGHLNADEQYLPGVLQFVKRYFDDHPEVDFIVGNFLVVDANGQLLACRRSFTPKWVYFFSNYLYTMTCTTFYRENVVKTVKFDIKYRSVADMIYVYNVLRQGFKGAYVDSYIATFTDTGLNLSLDKISKEERARYLLELPVWYRLLMPIYHWLFYIDRWLHGSFKREKQIAYSIYKQSGDKTRLETIVVRPPSRWSFGRK